MGTATVYYGNTKESNLVCVVSNILDQQIPTFPPWTREPEIYPLPTSNEKEFEELRKRIEELEKLIEAGKKYDEATGQPDCELDEKIELLRKIADQLGVEIHIGE